MIPWKSSASSPTQPPSGLTLQHAARQALSAFKWLHGKSLQKLASKRMRVAETVALGEKRIVSILHVDGTQLLIGASGSNVSLLAILDEEQGKWRAENPA